jgi:RNA polymerase sigma-70 factor (ECF subfamily)
MTTKKDQEKFNVLYGQYHPLVRGVLYNMVGKEALEDLTQEAFIKIWNGLPKFAFQSTIKTWIYRITINTALDHLKKKKLNTNDYLDEQELNRILSDNLNEEELVEASLSVLDEESRGVVVLYYFEDLSLKEIAKALNLPEGTIKSKLFYAKKKMKSFFELKGRVL